MSATSEVLDAMRSERDGALRLVEIYQKIKIGKPMSWYTSHEVGLMADACLRTEPLTPGQKIQAATMLATLARIQQILAVDNPTRAESIERLSTGDFHSEAAHKEVAEIVQRLKDLTHKLDEAAAFLAHQGRLF